MIEPPPWPVPATDTFTCDTRSRGSGSCDIDGVTELVRLSAHHLEELHQQQQQQQRDASLALVSYHVVAWQRLPDATTGGMAGSAGLRCSAADGLWFSSYDYYDGPWASSDYAGAGCLSFLSRPLHAGPPLTMSDCAAFTDLLDGLMHLLGRRDVEPLAPRVTCDGFISRLLAARTHCDMTFGSAEEARLRCALHILLGEVAHCAGTSRGVLVRFSAHCI